METTCSFTDQQLKDLLTGAFEGGSNYWIDSIAPVWGSDYSHEAWKREPEPYYHWNTVLAVRGNGSAVEVTVDDDGEIKQYTLDRAAIEKGLAMFPTVAPVHFADLIADNTDAITADVFLQLCLFGEVVYG